MSTTLFNLEEHGPEGLESAMRRLPMDAALWIKDSGLKVTRSFGGSFRVTVPPKAGAIRADATELKSLQTAPGAVVKTHADVLERIQG
jgi:hypothetical protein